MEKTLDGNIANVNTVYCWKFPLRQHQQLSFKLDLLFPLSLKKQKQVSMRVFNATVLKHNRQRTK